MKTKPKAPYHSESELYMMMDFTPKKIAEYIAQLESALKECQNPHDFAWGIALEPTETISIEAPKSASDKPKFKVLDGYICNYAGDSITIRTKDKGDIIVDFPASWANWNEWGSVIIDSYENHTVIHADCLVDGDNLIFKGTTPF